MIALILFACLEPTEYVNPLAVDDDGDGYTEFGGDQNDADPNYVNDVSCPDVHLTCPTPVVTCPSVTVDTVVCPEIPSCPELPEIPSCPEPVECPDVNVECPSVPTNTGTGTSETREYFTEMWGNTNPIATWTNTDSRTFIITGVYGGGSGDCSMRLYSSSSTTGGYVYLNSLRTNGQNYGIGYVYEVPMLSGDTASLHWDIGTSWASNCMFTGYWVSYE
jgi:hypothetical protein